VFPGEVRIEKREDGDSPVLRGHAAVFDKLSLDLGGFREKISPGAFLRAIKEDDVRALFNHDPDHILGRTTNDTLRLSEDDEGLLSEIDMPDTTVGRDLTVSISRGDVDAMSISFLKIRDSWEEGEGGEPDIRTLEEVELFDVSPVTFPAYPDTDVALRSYAVWCDSQLPEEEEVPWVVSIHTLVIQRELDKRKRIMDGEAA